jgi:hypothetical protein
MSGSEIIKYELLPQFFCPKEEYFKNLKKKIPLSQKNVEYLFGMFNQYKVGGNYEFEMAMKNKKMFNEFYIQACKNLDALSHDIITKKGGLLYFNGKKYFIK